MIDNLDPPVEHEIEYIREFSSEVFDFEEYGVTYDPNDFTAFTMLGVKIDIERFKSAKKNGKLDEHFSYLEDRIRTIIDNV